MGRMKTVLWDAFRSVSRHERLLTANLTGNAFLGFIFFFWASSSAFTWGEILRAAPLLTALGFFLMWLHAATLAAFHPGMGRTPFMPALRRLHRFLPWALALAGILALFQWMANLLGIFVWVVGLTAVLSLLPLASQAAGGGFSVQKAQDIVFDEVYWLTASVLAVGGLYLPVLVFSWNPKTDNIVLQLLSASLRIGIPYSLAVTSWVLLAAVIGCLGTEQPAPEAARRALAERDHPAPRPPAHPRETAPGHPAAERHAPRP